MAYTALTTASNVQNYYSAVFTSTSTPSLTAIGEWIDIATAEIYGALSEVYTLEITDTDDLLQLRDLADLFVRIKVNEIIRPASARKIEGGNLQAVTENLSMFYKRLKMLKTGETELVNSARNSSKLLAYSYNQVNCIEPESRKDEDLW